MRKTRQLSSRFTSNKQLLVVLWELFPGHPHLLPASAESLAGIAQVRKPRLGREGANVTILDADGSVIAEAGGGYGEEGFVYQARAELARDPEQLCESSDDYHGYYGGGYWLGPIIYPSSRWSSARPSSWAPVSTGGFAAHGATQPDVVQRAPAGAKVGSKATLSGGFGGTGKSGFGSHVGG
ncbi:MULTISPECIES: glutathionylspermidine synthase family protein [unclassified Rathayibacter]|uniref:glutathionylspermidine synthase family protein n=1 Tax=unclassified Rathayibacter TaxID=2609250 RepID=UPI00188CD493|nr:MULTISPECIES: glutathionylspermidine synthase family protein [unclassified Rathayibacter]MBF4461945.1 glutathionylspermidine synthase family protein [Rathayibacter sp. VKM Ac-2879]MBF4504012.1 glutathionylspermidine synthase family protein [Rathayibacter sp. VKM Ac-2878]